MATNEEVRSFISKMGPIIKKVAQEHGYKFPSVVLAQACVESAYGTSSLGYKYHNYFGMKCGSSWTGKSVNLKTKEEYTVGTLTTIRDNFRVYDSVEAGINGYFDFISKPRYANLKAAVSPKDYAEKIKTDGYATSSTYVNTLMNTVMKYNLTMYDEDQTTVKAAKKADPEIVRKVLERQMGNGASRVANIEAAGYDYRSVQNKVNEVCNCAEVIKTMKQSLGEYFDMTLKLV